jgi:hypothetical protein
MGHRSNLGPCWGAPHTNQRYAVDETVWLDTNYIVQGFAHGRISDGTSVRLWQDVPGWRAYLRGVEMEGTPTRTWEEAAGRLHGPLLTERKRLRFG